MARKPYRPVPKSLTSDSGTWTNWPSVNRSGWWWHWDGDPETAPVLRNVEYHQGLKCFLYRGVWSQDVILLHEVGGWWLSQKTPCTPEG